MSFVSRLFSTQRPMVQKACFGAGCFWGTEKFFRKEFNNGLIDAKVGYMGGASSNPTYKQVCTGTTNHAEVLLLEYDENKINYSDLVRFFYRMHDPTTLNSYSPEQEAAANEVTKEISDSKKYTDPIVTQIVPHAEFWTAEDYHQKYLEANPGGYCNHRLRW